MRPLEANAWNETDFKNKEARAPDVPVEPELALYLFVYASDLSENRFALFGPMRQEHFCFPGIESAKKGKSMSIARVTEITSSSTKSFEDAIETGVTRAMQTLQNVEGVWVREQKILVENGRIAAYRVNLEVVFTLID